MFDALSSRLQDVFQSLKGETRLTESTVEAALLDLRRTVGEGEAARYSRAGRLDYSWQGLARYWRKKSA